VACACAREIGHLYQADTRTPLSALYRVPDEIRCGEGASRGGALRGGAPPRDQPAHETMGKRETLLQNTPIAEVHHQCSGCNATTGVPTEHRSMATFLSIFAKLPLTPRMNEHIAVRTREAMATRDYVQL
jgi:hypothetical protein